MEALCVYSVWEFFDKGVDWGGGDGKLYGLVRILWLGEVKDGSSGIWCLVAGFKALADLIASFPILSQNAQFIFVPGPTDPWSSNTLPRPPIPDTFVKPILNKVPKAVFTTNPARIRYFNQEIVIFREDLMGRMMRNMVQIKEEAQAVDMKKYVSDFENA